MSISNYPENFIVVDTEGRDLLREIAVVDATGKLIYEAFVVDSDANKELKQKSLGEILQEFQAIAKDKIIVCHYADHDRKVIEQTYRTQNQQFSPRFASPTRCCAAPTRFQVSNRGAPRDTRACTPQLRTADA